MGVEGRWCVTRGTLRLRLGLTRNYGIDEAKAFDGLFRGPVSRRCVKPRHLLEGARVASLRSQREIFPETRVRALRGVSVPWLKSFCPHRVPPTCLRPMSGAALRPLEGHWEINSPQPPKSNHKMRCSMVFGTYFPDCSPIA